MKIGLVGLVGFKGCWSTPPASEDRRCRMGKGSCGRCACTLAPDAISRSCVVGESAPPPYQRPAVSPLPPERDQVWAGVLASKNAPPLLTTCSGNAGGTRDLKKNPRAYSGKVDPSLHTVISLTTNWHQVFPDDDKAKFLARQPKYNAGPGSYLPTLHRKVARTEHNPAW